MKELKFNELKPIQYVGPYFKLHGGKVFYRLRKKNSTNLLMVDASIVVENCDSEWYKYNNNFYFNSEEFSFCKFNPNNSEIEVLERKLCQAFLIENCTNYVQLSNFPDFDKRILYSLDFGKIIKEVKNLYYWLNLEECINIDFDNGWHVITKENLDSQEVIWSFDLRELDKFNHQGQSVFDSCLKIIGNTTNELWLATKANRLLVLDLYSGEMIHLFEFEPYGYYAPTARFASLVNDTIVMFHGSLTIIDCKTKDILTYKTPMDLGDDFSNFEVEDASQVQGDYATFIATKKGSQYMKTMIGIFDYKNQKLAWLHEFPHEEKVSISNPPIIEGNRLYALSYGHVLHVFEKEENQ
jgi:hypothetical protein